MGWQSSRDREREREREFYVRTQSGDLSCRARAFDLSLSIRRECCSPGRADYNTESGGSGDILTFMGFTRGLNWCGYLRCGWGFMAL